MERGIQKTFVSGMHKVQVFIHSELQPLLKVGNKKHKNVGHILSNWTKQAKYNINKLLIKHW